MKFNDQVYFTPRKLQHLKLEEEIPNFSCITEMKVEDLAKEGNPQIYMLCGAGGRSTLRILRHGLAVTELAST
jgi:splicing factor 3B subunit 3